MLTPEQQYRMMFYQNILMYRTPISYLVDKPIKPELTSTPLRLSYQPIYSKYLDVYTHIYVSNFMDKLIECWGMKPINFEQGEMNDTYVLKYHYVELQFYLKHIQSSNGNTLAIVLTLKHDLMDAYNNTVDALVFREISKLHSKMTEDLTTGEELNFKIDTSAMSLFP